MSYRDREYDDTRDHYRRDDRDDRDYRRRSPSPVRDYHRGPPPAVSSASSSTSHRGGAPMRGGDFRGSISRGDPYSYRGMMGGLIHPHPHPDMAYGGMIDGREMCRDFMRGMCTRGARCPYIHAHPAASPYVAAAPPYPAPIGLPIPPPPSSGMQSNKVTHLSLLHLHPHHLHLPHLHLHLHHHRFPAAASNLTAGTTSLK